MHYRLTLIFLLLLCPNFLSAQKTDFSDAVIFYPKTSNVHTLETVRVLKEEIQKRTRLQLTASNKLPKSGTATVVLSLYDQISTLPAKYKSNLDNLNSPGKEGFHILWAENEPILFIIGQDARGLLYGVGRLLRKMEWGDGKLSLDARLSISGSPKYPIRGHQLGYRPKTNSYDAFSVSQFDQYIREMALFGANSIEIVPPRTDDDFTSRHMQLPAIEMIAEQSRIADKYDQDVWMWYPNMGTDYSHPDSIQKELEERHKVFSVLPRLDALFVPGGDPGELEPDVLFDWLQKVTGVLHQYHPNAKIWVSPQVFRPTQDWYDSFFRHVNREYDWFGGVVFGPWVKIPLPELRAMINQNIPIRRYPDITHSLSSQYPIPEWDLAFAMTLGRECINPRPIDQKSIHNALDQYADGSLSYSEGTNDDVNKFIWTGQDWDPNTPVIETLRDYARFFFGPEWTEAAAQGFLLQEENFKGPLLTNETVPLTLMQWQHMEEKASPALLKNFRFQMGLLRAYYDAYVQRKLMYETELEMRAKEILHSKELSSQEALQMAKATLEKAWKEPVATSFKEKCLELAEQLYQSIGAQLTIDPHGAASGRGNFVDNMDALLNDAPWLLDQIDLIDALNGEEERQQEIRKLLSRNDPGPGGFYENFGSPKSWKRVIAEKSPEEDPGSLYSPRISFGVGLIGQEWVHEVRALGFEGSATPQSWMTQINTLYDQPLKVRYDLLDPEANYTLKVAYTGRFRSKMKLNVDGGLLIHDFIQTGAQPMYEFKLPKEVYSDGEITFTWTCGEGERGAQVAELWLIRE